MVEIATGLVERTVKLGDLVRVQIVDLCLLPAALETTGKGGNTVDVAQQLDARTDDRRLISMLSGFQIQTGITQQAFAHFLRAHQPGGAQLSYLATGQLAPGDRRCQPLAILRIAAGDRHKVTHRCMGWNSSATHLLLDRRRQVADQAQAT